MLRLLQTRESFLIADIMLRHTIKSADIMPQCSQCFADIMLRLLKNEKKKLMADIILRLTIETSIRVSGYYAILFF